MGIKLGKKKRKNRRHSTSILDEAPSKAYLNKALKYHTRLQNAMRILKISDRSLKY